MDAQALIIWLIVGAITGWLAGMVVKGGGFSWYRYGSVRSLTLLDFPEPDSLGG